MSKDRKEIRVGTGVEGVTLGWSGLEHVHGVAMNVSCRT